ncbi:hypothetical protein QRO08_09855 [Paracidovorax citrulli]|uniref:Uncharacterized protein n=2 Tax=Paracidovorax citrulli TaxID=80869 RepID=A1TPR8_PARC0|nr:hypothetical protein [Paracidovorax citrulli]ABM32956.1 hypothetical protein Aave_2381 [Paracidovorax citrulli AAC00-1]ATG93077.1 hypothetical protein CQB05_02640 [Paracidovorax citrulli]MVT36768.1 hypothetical protein [Paracidovorax citrulli]PVY67176.1 hypothetical protein C8E08_4611 [Paracidovorax citrulli]REG68661.1 hypothetical protein C8E07_1780 [Paracidovorax citrulli]
MAAPRGGLAAGILQGQQIFQNFHGQFQQAQQQRALDEVASARPVESTGFTADQGQQLESLAKQGFDNITFDDGAKAYVAKNSAGEARTVAMQGVTDFLGERTAGSMGRDQQDNLRMRAMADAIGRTDPARGLQMSLQAQQGLFAARKQGREEKQWAREDGVERIDAEMGAKLKQALVGPDGQPRQATADDYLANTRERALALAQAGYAKEADQAAKDHMAQSHIQIQLQAAARKEAAGKAAAALAAGDYTQLADVYNRFVPSGDKVTGIEAGKDGQLLVQRTGLDGKPMPPITLKDRGEALAMLKALDDPMALYQYSQHELLNQLRLRAEARADNADRRADNADGRAAAAHGLAMADRGERLAEKRELRDVREALARETDPKMTPTQLRAVRAGILQTPGSDTSKLKYDYDPTKVQKAFGETSTDPLSGKEKVKRNPAAEQEFQEFMADNPSIRDTDEGLVRFNRAKVQKDRASRQAGDAVKAQVRNAMSQENLDATAKKYGMTVDEVIKELQKQGISK